ncbi:hypothetical protein I6M44_11855 [Shewanella algae]|uniref:WD40/YVTN/BNR-like repeat-containing protein n=1 Tax=Shewanella algae TaxID=38313 RepID=UPI001AADBBB9|nr:YCF48-related protein [Shewanella algae]MBO2624761.1 hypothetical protein [Shewanella algae]
MSYRMLQAAALGLGILTFQGAISPLHAETQSATGALTGQLQPLAVHSLMLDIAQAGSTMVAVGERGHILRLSADANQWQQVATPSQAQLTKVFFLDANHGWAVGHDATILATQDGGLSWQQQFSSPELARPLLDVWFADSQNGIAVGAYGLFLRTTDGGQSWQKEFHPELLSQDDADYLADLKQQDEEAYQAESDSILPHFNRVIALEDKRLLMVGELGMVAISEDGGRLWQRLEFIYDGSLFNAIERDKQLYVFGLRGHAFSAPEDMSQWQEIKMPLESTLNAAAPVKGSLLLVGNGGAVIRLDNNLHAELVTQRRGENLSAVAVDPKGRLWIAGTKGLFELKQQ